ncbi:hypothetical protein M514_01809 [Trichuris suis]|uniref:EGF-like domain-containing protein n=1 Tax=Trichuris suis TaxID=68888 RepID=A0A085NT87_9BILA|nr:hypothetical protein M514_01809 [Trichuris suis]
MDHKTECHSLSTCKPWIPDIEVRLLGRIVARQMQIQKGQDQRKEDFYLNRTSDRRLMDIWHHETEMKADPEARKNFEVIYNALVRFYGSKKLLDKAAIFRIHSRNYINRHAINDLSYLREIGKGLYLDLCSYDHSCCPNAIYICHSFIATLRPLYSDVDLTDRKSTFYSYIDLLASRTQRRQMLQEAWYFQCCCNRCCDETDHLLTAIRCPKCTASVAIYEGDTLKKGTLRCPACGNDFEMHADEAVQLMKDLDAKIAALNFKDAKNTFLLLEELIAMSGSLLAAENVYLARLYQARIRCTEPSNVACLLEGCLKALPCMQRCFPKNHPALAYHFMSMGIYQLRLSIPEAKENLKTALDRFCFSLGSSHELTNQSQRWHSKFLKRLAPVNRARLTVHSHYYPLKKNQCMACAIADGDWHSSDAIQFGHLASKEDLLSSLSTVELLFPKSFAALLAFAVSVDELNGCPDQVSITSDQLPLDGFLRLVVSNITEFDLRCSNQSLLYWKSAHNDRVIPLCTLNFSHLSYEHLANFSEPLLVGWTIEGNLSRCQSASLQLSGYAEFEIPIGNGSVLFDTDCACYHSHHANEPLADLSYTSTAVSPSSPLALQSLNASSDDNVTSLIPVDHTLSVCQFGNETSCNGHTELSTVPPDSESIVTPVLVRRPTDDPCLNDPCQPNGICVSRNNSFECRCSANFCGEFCQYPLVCSHECNADNKSCIAAQVCVCLNAQTPPPPTPSSSSSSSASTETTTQRDVCHEHSCLNNGTCVPMEDGTSYQCICAPGFIGKLCENPLSTTVAHNVTPSTTVPTVVYTVNISSPLLEDVITTVKPQGPKCDWPCLSDSRCTGRNRCNCSSYYLGANCGFLHTCKMYMPCQHGGNCVLLGLEKLKWKVTRFQTNAPFRCLCKEDWTGKHCETPVRAVDIQPRKPCMNNGRYDAQLGRCDCEGTGHVGDLCEIEINRCAQNSSLCGANGICTKTGPNMFKCNCLAGYQGETCDVTVNSADSSAVIIGAVFGSLSAIGLILGSIVMARYVRRSRELKVNDSISSAGNTFWVHTVPSCTFPLYASKRLGEISFLSIICSHFIQSEHLGKFVHQKSMSLKYDVFLGGSCGASSWREDAIAHLERLGLTFFNPQRNFWKEDMVKLERYAKENSRVLLFVVDYRQRSLVTLIEIVYLAALQAPLIVVLPDEYRFAGSQCENTERLQTMQFVRRVLQYERIPTCVSLSEAMGLIESILFKTRSFENVISKPAWLLVFLKYCILTVGRICSLPVNLIFFIAIHALLDEAGRMQLEYLLRYRYPSFILACRTAKYITLIVCLLRFPLLFLLIFCSSFAVLYIILPALKNLSALKTTSFDLSASSPVCDIYIGGTDMGPLNTAILRTFRCWFGSTEVLRLCAFEKLTSHVFTIFFRNTGFSFTFSQEYAIPNRFQTLCSSLYAFYAFSCTDHFIREFIELAYAMGIGAFVVANFETVSEAPKEWVPDGASQLDSAIRSYKRAIFYLKDMGSLANARFFENDLNAAVNCLLMHVSSGNGYSNRSCGKMHNGDLK